MRQASKIKTLLDLIYRSDGITKAINLITIYRIVTAPVLLILIFTGDYAVFKWMLLISFSTDLIDGYLARKYKVNSALGAKLDSIGDDLTVLVAIVGLFVLKFDFIKEQLFIVIVLLSLYCAQVLFSFYRYGKISSFHTYSAKLSALLQGIFLLSFFFFETPIYPLFYLASLVTFIQLVEETILVFILPKWENDVKGVYWVLKRKKRVFKY